MLSHARIRLLLTLPCLLVGLGFDAAAQAGRLAGTVAYSAPGAQAVAARNVTVIVSGAYARTQTRTDNNGNFVLVLAAGTYRVQAYGAAGYTQYQQVTGYVRAYADSIITPNPLFLVPSRYRSSDSMTQPVLTHGDDWNAHATVAVQSRLTLEIAAQERGKGRLYGRVKIGGKNRTCQDNSVPAGYFLVTLQGPYSSGGTQLRTSPNGTFVTEDLPPGTYTITVSSEKYPNYHHTTRNQGTVVAGMKNNLFRVLPDPICMIPK